MKNCVYRIELKTKKFIYIKKTNNKMVINVEKKGQEVNK